MIEHFAHADVDAGSAPARTKLCRPIDRNAEDCVGRAALIKKVARCEVAFTPVDGDGECLVATDEVRAVAPKMRR